MKISDKYQFFREEDIDIVKKIIEGKKLSGTGEIISRYEDKLSDFFESDYALAVSSGTSAIQTALFACGVDEGDEVIVSPTCPSMTVFPIIYVGAKIVFCDTAEDNFGLEIEEIEKSITKKTKAIIEVPMWGYPTDVKKLSKFAKSKNIPLILDLAQAHGTKLNGKYLSSYGDISCFSTHDRKILATGEGGFVLTDNQAYYDKMSSFIKFGNMGGIDFGLNFKLGALQAGLGINRINLINEQLEKRKENAEYIKNRIENSLVKEFEVLDSGSPNYYTLLLNLNFDNNDKIISLLSDNGIPSDIKRYNYKVLYQYPFFEKYKKICSNSEKLVKNITTIPVHPALSKQELDYVINKINNLS